MRNDNQGAIWKNDRKQADTHPDYTGSATIDGVEYWVNAWRSTSDNPKAPLLKFSFKIKHERASTPAPRPAQQEEFNDDIPF